jgi:hypothetical protein
MSTHAPQTLLLVTNNGSVMTSGFSTRLGKGQFGIIDKDGTRSSLGQKVSNTIPTTPKNRKFELVYGMPNLLPNKFQTNKAFKSRPFKLSDVTDISVTNPKIGISVDKWLFGYDGINDSTAISLNNGDNEEIDITLEGEAIGMLGYENSKVTLKLYLEAPNTGTFTNHEIVEKAVERFKALKLKGGIPVTNYVKITPVNSTNTVAVTQPSAYAFYTLTVPDEGRENDLGLVQAQYPLFKVERTDYDVSSLTSTYTILAPDPTTLTAFSKTATTLADANCDGVPEVTNTATTYSWVKGSAICNVTTETYYLQLGDTKCGTTRLSELTAYYAGSGITVTEIAGSSDTCQRRYQTTVISNVVCEECHKDLRDLFVTSAPIPFEFIDWTKVAKTYDPTAKMGIHIEGKENIFAGTEEYKSQIPFLWSSTRISIANKANDMTNSSFNVGTNGRFSLKLLSMAKDPTGLGKDLFNLEKAFLKYATDNYDHVENNFAKYILGEESLLKPLKYYILYSIKVSPREFSQSFSATQVENFNYLIAVEEGKQASVEAYVNALATACGLPTVTA